MSSSQEVSHVPSPSERNSNGCTGGVLFQQPAACFGCALPAAPPFLGAAGVPLVPAGCPQTGGEGGVRGALAPQETQAPARHWGSFMKAPQLPLTKSISRGALLGVLDVRAGLGLKAGRGGARCPRGINGTLSSRASCCSRITRPSTTASSWASWRGNKWTPAAWGRPSKPCASRHPSSGSGERGVSCIQHQALVQGSLPCRLSPTACSEPCCWQGEAPRPFLEQHSTSSPLMLLAYCLPPSSSPEAACGALLLVLPQL